jgi:8-oxo-dGTP pyrophosphatase MutT (NUDIX family)
MPKKWKTLGTKQIFGNRIFGFREDTVKSPKTDNTHPVWVMDAPTWVNIIPITKEKKVIMIKQYRFGSQEISLEIPGGMVDAGEDAQSAATREMKEETGYESEEVHTIGKISPNPALMSNHTYSYVAYNVKKTGDQQLDNMEDIEVLEVDLNQIPTLITNGEIDHSLVVSAFYLLDQFEK